jgi:hypothetical protein
MENMIDMHSSILELGDTADNGRSAAEIALLEATSTHADLIRNFVLTGGSC